MRVKVEYRSTSRDVYNRFCQAHPDIKMAYKKWVEIIYAFNRAFRDYILETGEKVKFPWGFGDFAISKKLSKKFKEHNGKTYINLPIDWKKTKEAGKRIYNFNSHSDGYRCKWYWFVKDARFSNSCIWIFKASRESSRKITEYINKPSKEYLKYYKEWSRK